MKAMFINYHPVSGVSIDSYPEVSATVSGDVRGLVQDIAAKRPGCCLLVGAQHALEDGELWHSGEYGDDLAPEMVAVQEAIEEVHEAICKWEALA